MSSTASNAAQITLNGEPAQVETATVAALVQHLKLDATKVAVERNLAIVPRSQYAATPIQTGDRIEIVGFIGGG